MARTAVVEVVRVVVVRIAVEFAPAVVEAAHIAMGVRIAVVG